MDVLPAQVLPIDSINNTDSNITAFSLRSFGDKPYFEILTKEKKYTIAADSGDSIKITPAYDEIKDYAQRWSKANIIRVDTLRELEQWIPFGRLKEEFPIYKFYFGDEDKHQLYISSRTGEALQFTDKDNRFWSWVGAIPHWVYFTSLRQDSQKWVDVVVFLSGIGCIMCLSGIVLGIRSYIMQYRRRKKIESPYKKRIYKWHHILGFVFGIFVFTFVFSGMMSLAAVPKWMVNVHNPDIQKESLAKQPIKLSDYKLNIQKILDKYPDKVKSIEWDSFGHIPLYKVIVDNRLITLNASSENIQNLELNEADIKDRLTPLHKENISASLMTGYDNYYVGLSDHLPLPVYKVEVEDADHSTYYVNPKNGSIRYFNTNSKARHWTYGALHSFKFKFAVENKIVWNIMMWTTMIGGTLVSISGVWLGFRYLKRKIKTLKKHIFSNKHTYDKRQNNSCGDRSGQ